MWSQFNCDVQVFPLNGVTNRSINGSNHHLYIPLYEYVCKTSGRERPNLSTFHPYLRAFPKLSCFHHHLYGHIQVWCSSRLVETQLLVEPTQQL